MQPTALWLACFARQAEESLKGSTLVRVFSTSSQELYVEFESAAWKTEWHKGVAYLFAVDQATLPRKNRMAQFRFLEGGKITGIHSFPAERAVEINIGMASLMFRLFGNKGDVLAYEGNGQAYSYRYRHDEEHVIPKHQEGFLTAVHQQLSSEEWKTTEKGASYLPESYMAEMADENRSQAEWNDLFSAKMASETWVLCLDQKEQPCLALGVCEHKEIGKGKWLDLSGKYYRAWFRFLQRQENKRNTESTLRKALKGLDKQQSKLDKQLQELNRQNYRIWADNLMAAMHLLEKGADQVILEDVYGQGRIKIPVKKELTAQQNAERYYRKARKQHIEKEKLEAQIIALDKQRQLLEKQLIKLEEGDLPDEQSVQNLNTKNLRSARKFREFQSGVFKISVGKSAENNDELLRIAHKNDYWLHARKLKGSHVIIHCANAWKEVSLHTKNYAASLAAWYSEGKGSTLVPVIITQRKYVRKKKGLHKGEVIAEKEDVILAEPIQPSSQ